MIDLHTHFLPGIDDGARDSETAVAMLEKLIAGGTDLVVATPHYYCLDVDPAGHRARAEQALETLKTAWQTAHGSTDALPEIRLGAEIYLAESLQYVQAPELLKISGSELMLFEMPFSGFHSWIPRLIDLMANKCDAIPVIAHIDRYLRLYGRTATDDLERIPRAAFQFNSESFEDRTSLKYMYSLIKRGYTVFFASDCHGAHRRPPDLGEKLPGLEKKISKKFAPDTYREIVKRQYELLRADRYGE